MKRWQWLLPFAAGVLAYAPAFFGGLVWDDAVVIDYQLDAFQSPGDIFRPPENITRWSYAYYRPVIVASYLLDARLFGAGSPAGPHAANVLYHLLAVLAVGWLTRRLLADRPWGRGAAIAAATIFAVHPLHSEAVSWIAGRSDVLATLFLVSAAVTSLRWRDRRSWWALVLSPLLFLCALLSKEIAITGLVLLPLTFFLAKPEADSVGAAAVGAASAAILFSWLAAILTFFWLRSGAGIPEVTMPALDWALRLQRLFSATAWYVLKLVIPWPQSAFVSWQHIPRSPWSVLIVLAAVGATAFAAHRAWKTREGTALVAASWFWMPLALLLGLAVFAANNTPLAERYFYLPSVGFSLALGAGFAAAVIRWRIPALVLVTIISVIGGALTFERALVWRDDLSLWTDTTLKTADGLPWMNLGVTQLARGEDAAAEVSFRRALEDAALDSRWVAGSHNGLAMIFAKRSQFGEAERHFREAISVHPTFVEPYYRLGRLYGERAVQFRENGQIAEADEAAASAISYLSTAAARYPGYHAARLVLAEFLAGYGAALEREGQNEKARRRYEAARDQLAVLSERIPSDEREGRARKLATDTGIDWVQLEREIDQKFSW